MIEEERDKLSEANDVTSPTSGEMSEALEAMKASSPTLAEVIDAAGVTPGGLVDSHDRATSDAPDADKPASGEQA